MPHSSACTRLLACRRSISWPLWAAGTFWVGSLGAHVARSGEEGFPLARCLVQTLAPGGEVRMAGPPVGGLVPRESGPIAAYRRTRSGDWNVPVAVDRDDPRIRLLLATPSGPLLVDLLVHVDGRSFRTAREEWIDSALEGDANGMALRADRRELEAAGRASPPSSAASGDVNSPLRQSPGALQRLREYVARSSAGVEREEARWLLAQWAGGPALMELQAGYAADRASYAPLWAVLDENGDRRISAAESASAQSRLRALDVDEDDWVTSRELAADRPPVVHNWAPPALTSVLSESTDWNAASRQLADLYGPGSVGPASPLISRIVAELGVSDLGSLTAGAAARLLRIESDIVVDVRFSVTEPADNTASIARLGGALRSWNPSLSQAEHAISLHLDRCVIELSAARLGEDATDEWNGQIAVGAVLDGGPLLRLVDVDNDHRLSLREVDSLGGMLAQLDVDGDGQLAAEEIPVPIRLAVTLGPHVHELLKSGTAAVTSRPASNFSVPEWFAGMDENNDRDLTPGEFLGTREQFDALDRDRSGRISVREAAQGTIDD